MGKRETPRKSTMLRMEEELFEELKALAEAEGRSINNTVIQAIKKYIKDSK